MDFANIFETPHLNCRPCEDGLTDQEAFPQSQEHFHMCDLQETAGSSWDLSDFSCENHKNDKQPISRFFEIVRKFLLRTRSFQIPARPL